MAMACAVMVLLVAASGVAVALGEPLDGHPNAPLPSASHTPQPPYTDAPAPISTPQPNPTSFVLDAVQAAWRLPVPVQRAVALADRGKLRILGGLTAFGRSTPDVTSFDLATGAMSHSPGLPLGVHDAAGVVFAGRMIVFGGGASTSVATVQQAGGGIVGSLPTARSDLAATMIGDTAYLVGGYDGRTFRRDVLATTDGISFRIVARLAEGVRYPAVAALGHIIFVIGGESPGGASTANMIAVDTLSGRVTKLGSLPQPLSHASAIVINGELFVMGGTDGRRRSDRIWRVDPVAGSVASAGLLTYAVADAAATVDGDRGYLVGGTGNDGTVLASIITLTPRPAAAVVVYSTAQPGRLAPGSDPGVLPGPVLIADENNNRLVEVSPAGQVLWEFPRPGDLAPGQSFRRPDDAFFTPDGAQIIATQETNFVVSLIDVATHRIVWQYGTPGRHGSGPNQLWNPDDAMVLPSGDVVISDIVNCRIIVVAKGQHAVAHSYGQVGSCRHDPSIQFGSPNGAFPLNDGNWLVTEINGDWVNEVEPRGKVLWSVHPPGIAYPSDTNEIGPNRYLTVDYSSPGQVLIFDRSGRTLWRYRPYGGAALNHPSLALGLANGDVILNDDGNQRVIVIDPRTNQVVWQYGVTSQPGDAAGLLSNPDGVDLAPPYSLLGEHLATLRTP